ncbi:MAG: hypothetical protein ACR2J8_12260 [Thermomicrobiales bacterium]
MDQSSFDRVARLLGSATSRRAGLEAALGAVFGAGALTADASAKKRGHPSSEGPCGPTRKDNACSRDSDCCTGLCNTRHAHRNTDKAGRCRCRQRGGACTETRNCCNSLGCFGGVCRSGPPQPSGCSSNADCSGEAVKKVCDTATGACVECVAAGDCPAVTCKTATCTTNTCGATTDADDTACATGQCKSGACVQCTTDAGCSSQATNKACKTSSNTCVQCTSDAACTGGTPACSVASNTCIACGVPTYPHQYTGSPLHTPAGIAIDATWTDHEIWVSNYAYSNAATDGKVGYMKKDGTGLTMGPAAGANFQGLALTSDRIPMSVYGDGTTGHVVSFDNTTLTMNGSDVTSSNDANFKAVYGIYADGSSTSGTLWFSTRVGGGNAGVWKFTIGVDAGPIQVFSSLGTYAGAITRGPGGYLYVAIENDNKVVVLDPALASSGSLPVSTTVATFTGIQGAFGIAFDGNTMYVSTSGASTTIERHSIVLTAGVPSATLVCSYSITVPSTFFTAVDPTTGLLWTPNWGATRPADNVTAIDMG